MGMTQKSVPEDDRAGEEPEGNWWGTSSATRDFTVCDQGVNGNG
jgi:hypothetical protein